MATLDRRIEALESAAGGNLPDLIILREVVTPGRIGEPIAVADIDGRRFESEPGESEQDFIARISDLAREVRTALGNRRPLVIVSAADLDL